MALLLLIFILSCPVVSIFMLIKINSMSKSYKELQSNIMLIKDSILSIDNNIKIKDKYSSQNQKMDSIEVSFNE